MKLSIILAFSTVAPMTGLIIGGGFIDKYTKDIQRLTSSYKSPNAKCCYHSSYMNNDRSYYYVVGRIKCNLNDKEVDCKETTKDIKKKKTDSIIATSVMGGLTALTAIGAGIAKIADA